MPKKRNVTANLHEILDAFLNPDIDVDHAIEIRWLDKYDGSTKWHRLFDEGDGPTRYGIFPYSAEYRIVTNS